MEGVHASAGPPGLSSNGHTTVDRWGRPVHATDVVHSEVLDELVLFSAGTSSAIALNESARAVWELCDGEHGVDEICAELAEAAGCPHEAIRDDVLNALATLRQLGLLHP